MDMKNDRSSSSRRTENDINGKIKKTRGKDEEVFRAVEEIKKAGVKC